MLVCSNCGKELSSDATSCESCGSSISAESTEIEFAVNTEPIVKIGLDVDGVFNELSNKWAWAMVRVDIFTMVLELIGVVTGLLPLFVIPIVFFYILKIVYWWRDLVELKRSGYRLGILSLFGLFLAPVYLFIRAAKTNREYGYAFASSVLFFMSLAIFLIPSLLTSRML